MSQSSQLLLPVIILVAWTLVMWLWMYATRIPAIVATGLKLDPRVPTAELMSQLPPRVRWKADNYNHLLEQPIIFYVVVLCLVVLEATSDINVLLAWAYVMLRVFHSLVQVLVNNIMYRFILFILSNIPLLVLTAQAFLALN